MLTTNSGVSPTLLERGITSALLWQACRELGTSRQFEPGRFSKAIRLALSPATYFFTNGSRRLLAVPGSNGKTYNVWVDTPCECDDYKFKSAPPEPGLPAHRRWDCKHRIAAHIVERALQLAAQAANALPYADPKADPAYGVTNDTIDTATGRAEAIALYDPLIGEYVATSALTGREYFGLTASDALARLSEGERVWREHHAKPHNQPEQNGAD